MEPLSSGWDSSGGAGVPLYMRGAGATSMEAEQEDEKLNKTYAGVLRSPARTTETDQLIKIRKLGTMGSMVEF